MAAFTDSGYRWISKIGVLTVGLFYNTASSPPSHILSVKMDGVIKILVNSIVVRLVCSAKILVKTSCSVSAE